MLMVFFPGLTVTGLGFPSPSKKSELSEIKNDSSVTSYVPGAIEPLITLVPVAVKNFTAVPPEEKVNTLSRKVKSPAAGL